MSQPAVAREQPWTVGRLLEWTARYLVEKGSEYPRLDTEVLLAHTLGCRRIDLYTRYDEAADDETRTRFRDLVRARVEGSPVAYLVGCKEFFSLKFDVSPAVLIPRPESEFVVLECLRLAASMSVPRILDIGTGSGNLAVAVAHQLKNARVTAVDLSAEALAVAARNAAQHGVGDRIQFLQGDLFAPLQAEERFDFILCNPPYIPTDEIKGLAIGVRDYEPHVALDGGADGFVVFERLAREAAARLAAGGHLIIEIGAPQNEGARRRLQNVGCYDLGATILDGSGHARVLRARLRAS